MLKLKQVSPLRSWSDDRGSAMPLFIFGVGFLLFASLILVSASAALQQQRRLNVAADMLALDMTMFSMQQLAAAKKAAAAEAKEVPLADKVVDATVDTVGEFAGPAANQLTMTIALPMEIESLYPGQHIRVDNLNTPTVYEVNLRICQPGNYGVLPAITPGEVCASSSAKQLDSGLGDRVSSDLNLLGN